MTLPNYPVQNIEENRYAFMSVGTKGIILKVVAVAFDEISDGIFNIGFGDYDFTTDSIDDVKVSDNGDMKKVLATVITILSDFLNKNPMATIYLSGSTLARTRLYQIAITTYFDEFSNRYEIFGQTADKVELFQKNTVYESFLVRKLL